jgi:hypothetical protein
MERTKTIKLKWDISGKGEEAWGSGISQYEGPVPPKGSYIAKVKRMTVGKINKEGDNKGKPRISILLEICGGAGAEGLKDTSYTYYGAPIWDGLNIIKSQAGRVNGFLHALTDGSKAAKDAVETSFWPPNGPNADKETNRAGVEEIHIKKIGPYVIASPAGEHVVRIVTRMGRDLEGNPRAEVNQYLPYTESKPTTTVVNGQVDDTGMEIIEDDADIIDAADFLDDETPVELDDVEAPPF